MRIIAILFSALVAASLSAQGINEAQRPAPVVGPPPEVQNPTPGADAVPERTAPPRREIVAQQNVPGTNGELVLDAVPAPFTSGVLLRAFSATPSVFAQLGASSASASFNVTDAAGTSILAVRGDGFSSFRRDQNAGTYVEINNASAGTSGATSTRSLRLAEGSTVKAELTSVGSGSTAAAGGANALQLWNYANAPIVFGTSSTERMRIFASGKVTVGGPYELGRLSSLNYADGSQAFFAQTVATVEANTAQADYAIFAEGLSSVQPGVTNSGTVFGIRASGQNFGAGTVSDTFGGYFAAGVYPGTFGSVTAAFGVYSTVQSYGGTVGTGYGLYIADINATNPYGVYQGGANDKNYFAGRVGIGREADPAYVLHVAGNVYFDGTVRGTKIQAQYQDLAEWVPATTDLEPGTVVILNPQRENEVMASTRAYDPAIAGVVSAEPGVILGEASPTKEQIATTGRVRVKVDASRGPIAIGDLLVTSDRPGYAMKSIPLDLAGTAIHRPGTLLGKALQPLEAGEGEILVLLSLQ